jgi:hypothetical protein
VNGANPDALEARALVDVAASGDHTVVIDLQRLVTGTWTTILSGTLTINSSTAARTWVSLSLNGALTFVDGDVFKAVVTVTGSTGSQAQGLIVELLTRQDP